jgi:hypothetical protein
VYYITKPCIYTGTYITKPNMCVIYRLSNSTNRFSSPWPMTFSVRESDCFCCDSPTMGFTIARGHYTIHIWCPYVQLATLQLSTFLLATLLLVTLLLVTLLLVTLQLAIITSRDLTTRHLYISRPYNSPPLHLATFTSRHLYISPPLHLATLTSRYHYISPVQNYYFYIYKY